jgi:hypothetical protein
MQHQEDYPMPAVAYEAKEFHQAWVEFSHRDDVPPSTTEEPTANVQESPPPQHDSEPHIEEPVVCW